jgi:tRNA pseudouridine-54 N-methylase
VQDRFEINMMHKSFILFLRAAETITSHHGTVTVLPGSGAHSNVKQRCFSDVFYICIIYEKDAKFR